MTAHSISGECSGRHNQGMYTPSHCNLEKPVESHTNRVQLDHTRAKPHVRAKVTG